MGMRAARRKLIYPSRAYDTPMMRCVTTDGEQAIGKQTSLYSVSLEYSSHKGGSVNLSFAGTGLSTRTSSIAAQISNSGLCSTKLHVTDILLT